MKIKREDLLLPFQHSLKEAIDIYRKRSQFTLTLLGLFLVWYFVFVVIYYLFIK